MFNLKRIFILLMSVLFISFLAGCTDHDDEHENSDSVVHDEDNLNEEHGDGHSEIEKNSEGLLHLNTKNVTRINSDDPFVVSVMTSQMIWPSTHSANQPGTIMLAPYEDWQIALSSLNLVHHPNDGPLLFTSNGEIPEIILAEVTRLNPKGNSEGTQIMIMGTLNEGEIDKLSGFDVVIVEEEDPAQFANKIDEIYADLTNSLPNSVIIGSMDEKGKEYSIPAGSWITHMDEPLLFVTESDIPEATKAALERRNGNAAIYVIGPETIISNEVVEKLNQYGTVTRIAGETPAEVSVEFAKFRDHQTNFGWDVTSPGHGLVFVSTGLPELAITAAPFAHLGKHAPMIWLENGRFTEQMHYYLEELKPSFEHEPTEGPYNHGYLIGNENLVPFIVQGFIDEMLEIVPANGDGHGGHGSHGH